MRRRCWNRAIRIWPGPSSRPSCRATRSTSTRNLNLGVLLKAEQDYDAALRHLNRALGVRPGDLPTRYQIASVALARRDTAAATGMLEAIVKEAPSFVEAHVALATAYYRLQRKADGDRERAIVERLNQEKEAKERARTSR